jgi:hypothetical protein
MSTTTTPVEQDEVHIRVWTLDEDGPGGHPVFVATLPDFGPLQGVKFLWVTDTDEVVFGLDELPGPSGVLPVPDEPDFQFERTADGFAQFLAMVAGTAEAIQAVRLGITMHIMVTQLDGSNAEPTTAPEQAPVTGTLPETAELHTGMYL